MALSLVGVAISVGVTAAGAHYLVGLEWRQALLIGAVRLLDRRRGRLLGAAQVPLPSRVTGVLEAESGFNDAPVVILVVSFATVGPVDDWYVLIGKIALELAIGIAIGLTVGFVGAYGLRHVALPASGLYPIAVMAIAITAYAAGAMAHGSGFLAVYLAAMVLGNAKLPHWPATRGFADGLGWIAQIGMFVLLGLLVTPHELAGDFWPAVIIGLVLTMVARPLEVFVSLLPFRIPWQEQALMSWAGLRGAVPIILATIPMVTRDRGQRPGLQHRLRARRRLHTGPGPDPAVAGAQARTRRHGRGGGPGASSPRRWRSCAGTCCPSPYTAGLADARRGGR
ncbi:cation:proton antiporter [Streptomyces cirratus]